MGSRGLYRIQVTKDTKLWILYLLSVLKQWNPSISRCSQLPQPSPNPHIARINDLLTVAQSKVSPPLEKALETRTFSPKVSFRALLPSLVPPINISNSSVAAPPTMLRRWHSFTPNVQYGGGRNLLYPRASSRLHSDNNRGWPQHRRGQNQAVNQVFQHENNQKRNWRDF